MEMREIGTSGLRISPIMFGGNVFGWTADEATSFKLLDAFVDAGFNAIDTADVYSRWAPGHQGGESEAIIGKWLKSSGKRAKIVLATKVGSDMGLGHVCLKRNYIEKAVEDSLRRLQTDVIDLYQSHRDDETIPQEEVAEAYAALIKAGKVRAIGASNFTAERLKSSVEVAKKLGVPRYESLQPAYNLYDRAIEADLLPLCREQNIGIISYFGLARGFLTGKYRSEADLTKSVRGGGVKDYLNERGFRILAALDKVAAEANASQAQVALAWLIARPGITAPIASATSVEQLTDILKAASLKLTPAQMDALTTASAP